MRYLIFILLGLTACTKEPKVSLIPEAGRCYRYRDESYKVIANLDKRYYYKHSWNDQSKIFNADVSFFIGTEIPCDRTGYEFDVVLFSLKRAQEDIEYLKNLTEPLRQARGHR
jgi:hypothetical protein